MGGTCTKVISRRAEGNREEERRTEEYYYWNGESSDVRHDFRFCIGPGDASLREEKCLARPCCQVQITRSSCLCCV
jgi:hypothetical protein